MNGNYLFHSKLLLFLLLLSSNIGKVAEMQTEQGKNTKILQMQ